MYAICILIAASPLYSLDANRILRRLGSRSRETRPAGGYGFWCRRLLTLFDFPVYGVWRVARNQHPSPWALRRLPDLRSEIGKVELSVAGYAPAPRRVVRTLGRAASGPGSQPPWMAGIHPRPRIAGRAHRWRPYRRGRALGYYIERRESGGIRADVYALVRRYRRTGANVTCALARMLSCKPESHNAARLLLK